MIMIKITKTIYIEDLLYICHMWDDDSVIIRKTLRSRAKTMMKI